VLPGPGGSDCQQPGSPGWPQQVCLLIILIPKLRKATRIFLGHGMGADQLVKKAKGMYVLPGEIVSAYKPNSSRCPVTFLQQGNTDQTPKIIARSEHYVI
jgi:hypothetical protein